MKVKVFDYLSKQLLLAKFDFKNVNPFWSWEQNIFLDFFLELNIKALFPLTIKLRIYECEKKLRWY